jgi:hypothetical protein
MNGITNSLQYDTREAIRIALFEVIKEAHAAYEKTYEKAKSGSTYKGHEGRKTKKRLTLPLIEKKNALDTAAQLNISIKEFLRLAVIWLADGIREETITSLTKSRRIGKDTIAYQWSREKACNTRGDRPCNLEVSPFSFCKPIKQVFYIVNGPPIMRKQKGGLLVVVFASNYCCRLMIFGPTIYITISSLVV